MHEKKEKEAANGRENNVGFFEEENWVVTESKTEL
jgi:hypothetical protein